MTGTALIRVDGGHRLGLGHVKRCLALAGELTAQKVRCIFACRERELSDLIGDKGYAVRHIPESADFETELGEMNGNSQFDADVCVLDISHRDTFSVPEDVPAYFSGLRKRYPALAVIDGLLEQCLVGEFDLPVDLAFIPYAGADEQRVRTKGAQLALGSGYFILDRSYTDLSAEIQETLAIAQRLLVTAGGSDPTGLTLKTFDALAFISDRKLDVRVAIGPAFAEDEALEIANVAGKSTHSVTLLNRPENLAEHMAWCDMAVSASGLTKYELAAMGTPAILLSIDEDHVEFNRSFDAYGTTRHLGVVKDVAASVLAGEIVRLADDPATRAELSDAGRAFLDGRGAERTAAAIIGLIGTGTEDQHKFQVSEATR